MATTKTKSNGDVVLYYTMPQAEYMYGCTPTSVGMLLGYYDTNGYNGTKLSNLISGTVALNSRGTDGDKYDMDAFDTVLGRAIASTGYVDRFYNKTPEHELPYTYKGSTTELNTSEWNCIADYLGTGQYWRGNSDTSTSTTFSTLEQQHSRNYSNGTITYGSTTRTIPYVATSMLWGLELYVESRGYSLDRKKSGSFEVDVNGGSFTFEDYMAEIDAGRPVIISITNHAMVGYGYNASTREIIFDDCYEADKRMTWGGTYYYSGASRSLQSVTTIVFKVSGGTTPSTGDTAKPTVSNIKVSTTAATNKNVTLTATFSDNVGVASSQYRIGSDGKWISYPSGGVTVTKNSTVYFRATDTSGNVSTVASYKVTNIDTTAPSKPTITVSTKKTTTKPVTVTAKFSSDSTKKEYSTDGKTWKTYSSALTFNANGTAYFRGTDAAGNVSAVASYTVSNIKGSAPAPTPTPTPGSADCDTRYNDWMYDTKTHKPNTSLFFNTLSPNMELPVDKAYDVNSGGKHNFVGFEDAIDYKIFRMNSAAKLNFTITATGASTFKVYALIDTGKKDKNGNSICKVKTIKKVSLKKKSTSNYVGYIQNLLLKKNDSAIEYYVSMAPTKASKKKGVYYNVLVDSDSVFFTKGNNTDDSKTVSSIKTVSIGSPGAKLLSDWVGFGDKVDYRRFTLSTAARLSFSIQAGDAAKFTLYKVVSKTKKGLTTYSLKAVQTVTIKKGKIKPTCLRLLQSGQYAFSVTSTNASKGGNADYSVSLASNSSFYNHVDRSNSDDKVIYKGSVINVSSAGYVDNSFYKIISPYTTTTTTAWVGYGDSIDYRKFALANDADLTFGVSAGDKVQFTIYKLVSKKTKSGYKYSLKKLKSKTAKSNGAGSYVANNLTVSLKAGTNYYYSVKSTNASKGGSAEYFVFVSTDPYGSSHSAALTGPENWDASAAQASALTMPDAAAGSGADGLNMSFADCGAIQSEFLLPSAGTDVAGMSAGAMAFRTEDQLIDGALSQTGLLA